MPDDITDAHHHLWRRERHRQPWIERSSAEADRVSTIHAWKPSTWLRATRH